MPPEDAKNETAGQEAPTTPPGQDNGVPVAAIVSQAPEGDSVEAHAGSASRFGDDIALLLGVVQ